jgi:hypothetical protein
MLFLRILAYVFMLVYCVHGLLVSVKNHNWYGIALFVFLGALVSTLAKPVKA